MLVALNSPTWTHAHITDTPSAPIFYWTRIQLLNPDSGSVPSLALHLDKSALISADSLCPPCTCSRTHTRIQLIPITVWLNESYDAHFSIPGSMNTNERQIWQSLVCVCVFGGVHMDDWQRKKKKGTEPYSHVAFKTGYVALWNFFFHYLFFIILPHSFVSMTSGSLLFPVHRSLIKPSNEEVMHNFICSSSTWGHFLTSLKSMIVSFWKAITLFQ